MVIVDTAAAYYLGDEGNSNVQQANFARLLRRMTRLRGHPAVLVNCHPIKNAARDNLVPMGGSAFLNEVDGNLTLWANNDRQTSLHWQGKFRGPEFEPVHFDLSIVSSDRVKDAEGRLMPSVVARPISELTLEAGEATREADENVILRLMHNHPTASFTDLARRAEWMTLDGRPSKVRVQRIMERLHEDRLVQKHRGGKYRLTEKGNREIGVGKKDENDDDFG